MGCTCEQQITYHERRARFWQRVTWLLLAVALLATAATVLGL
jgi:hypothetical protein